MMCISFQNFGFLFLFTSRSSASTCSAQYKACAERNILLCTLASTGGKGKILFIFLLFFMHNTQEQETVTVAKHPILHLSGKLINNLFSIFVLMRKNFISVEFDQLHIFMILKLMLRASEPVFYNRLKFFNWIEIVLNIPSIQCFFNLLLYIACCVLRKSISFSVHVCT